MSFQLVLVLFVTCGFSDPINSTIKQRPDEDAEEDAVHINYALRTA
jgi:hypothetical protein